MRIQTENAAEEALIRTRLRAVRYALGPGVEITAMLTDGTVLRPLNAGLSPAAQCASLNERLEDALSRQESRGSR